MNNPVQQFMMITGIGILCWVIIRMRFKGHRKAALPVRTGPLGHNANATGYKNQFSGTASLGAPPDVLKWQVELHDLGRELKGELDSKMLAVRSLTRQYDLAAHRLGELIKLAEQVALPPQSPVGVALRLADQGWEIHKIAQAISMSETDTQELLAAGQASKT